MAVMLQTRRQEEERETEKSAERWGIAQLEMLQSEILRHQAALICTVLAER